MTDGSERQKHVSGKKVVPLGALKPGDQGYVVALEGGREFTNRISSMGISVGCRIEVMHHDGAPGANGAVVVRTGETRLMIGHGMADKVMVRARQHQERMQ